MIEFFIRSKHDLQALDKLINWGAVNDQTDGLTTFARWQDLSGIIVSSSDPQHHLVVTTETTGDTLVNLDTLEEAPEKMTEDTFKKLVSADDVQILFVGTINHTSAAKSKLKAKIKIMLQESTAWLTRLLEIAVAEADVAKRLLTQFRRTY